MLQFDRFENVMSKCNVETAAWCRKKAWKKHLLSKIIYQYNNTEQKTTLQLPYIEKPTRLAAET